MLIRSLLVIAASLIVALIVLSASSGKPIGWGGGKALLRDDLVRMNDV